MKNNNEFIKNELITAIRVTGIYTVHYFKYGRHFRFPEESHDFWELVFLDSGNANITNDEDKLTLTQGEAFLHKPNAKHTIYTDDKFANSAIISFECKSKALKQISNTVLTLNEYEKSLLNKIVSETKASYSDKLNEVNLKKMTKKISQPFGGDQVIKNNIELLLISLIRNKQEQKNISEEININISSHQIVNSINALLLSRLDSGENINLDEISFRLGFSKSYIKSQFKKKTGKSIIQYYIIMKIEKAKKLLSQHKYTVSEIADVLGFDSVYYFSRQFKLHTDMSPTEYINSIKADNVL